MWSPQVVFHGIEGRREVFLDGARGNAKLLVRSVFFLGGLLHGCVHECCKYLQPLPDVTLALAAA